MYTKINFTSFSSIRIIVYSFYNFLVRKIVKLNLKFAVRSEPYNVNREIKTNVYAKRQTRIYTT